MPPQYRVPIKNNIPNNLPSLRPLQPHDLFDNRDCRRQLRYCIEARDSIPHFIRGVASLLRGSLRAPREPDRQGKSQHAGYIAPMFLEEIHRIAFAILASISNRYWRIWLYTSRRGSCMTSLIRCLPALLAAGICLGQAVVTVTGVQNGASFTSRITP